MEEPHKTSKTVTVITAQIQIAIPYTSNIGKTNAVLICDQLTLYITCCIYPLPSIVALTSREGDRVVSKRVGKLLTLNCVLFGEATVVQV